MANRVGQPVRRNLDHKIILRFMLLTLAFGCLQACSPGIIKVDGPEQLPSRKKTVSINRDVYFEVCVSPDRIITDPRWKHWKSERTETIREILKRYFNIHARPEAPAIEKPYVQFLFTEAISGSGHDSEPVPPLMVMSIFSFGVIPFYGVERHAIDIQFVARDADGGIVQGGYTYEYQDRYFHWLPLILRPDIVVLPPYINPRKKNLGLELVLNRFIYDASERMRQGPSHTKGAEVFKELKCP